MRSHQLPISHPINSLIRLRWAFKWDKVRQRGELGRDGWRKRGKVRCQSNKMSLISRDNNHIMSLIVTLLMRWRWKRRRWWMRLQALDGVPGVREMKTSLPTSGIPCSIFRLEVFSVSNVEILSNYGTEKHRCQSLCLLRWSPAWNTRKSQGVKLKMPPSSIIFPALIGSQMKDDVCMEGYDGVFQRFAA